MTTGEHAHGAADQLLRDGYAVVPQFVLADAVSILRQVCAQLTTGGVAATVPASAVLSRSELARVIFDPDGLRLQHALLQADTLVMYPNLTVRKNAATDWHIDAAFKDGLGGTQAGPEFLQCAVYLQDNDAEGGGGVDVVPGSHVRVRIDSRELAPATCLNIELQAVRVAVRPGDLVIWDARLLHRSSPRRASEATVGLDKFAIHWTLSKSRTGAVQFLHHLVRRGVPNHTIDPALSKRYQDIGAISLSRHVPPPAQAALRETGTFFATLAWADAPAPAALSGLAA